VDLFDARLGALSRLRGPQRALNPLEAENGAQAGLIVVQQKLGVVHARDGGNEAEP
jgi:hypothetical protein